MFKIRTHSVMNLLILTNRPWNYHIIFVTSKKKKIRLKWNIFSVWLQMKYFLCLIVFTFDHQTFCSLFKDRRHAIGCLNHDIVVRRFWSVFKPTQRRNKTAIWLFSDCVLVLHPTIRLCSEFEILRFCYLVEIIKNYSSSWALQTSALFNFLQKDPSSSRRDLNP